MCSTLLQRNKGFWQALARVGHAITSQAFSIGQTTFDCAVSLFLMVYLLFFLLRDGPALSARIVDAIPLTQQHKTGLFAKFVTVVRATVTGNILVALVQGALGGVALGFLSVPGAVLWGAVLAVLSLLPARPRFRRGRPLDRLQRPSPTRDLASGGISRP